ncbi:hypothetical protein [Dyadobacter luticola]|uniref:Glycosyltransferase RgtA/B/C/D-like domain-containing protein n=1 Tax=Dyadobacter luticola TaxID=1979387 RepID=A0A5R9L2C7_9BACT|nr:hypothetical protein [Dyadobacter luticola]TLV02537.1 hypothetical protein FEN17_02635 [Dyadobacter luticola]
MLFFAMLACVLVLFAGTSLSLTKTCGLSGPLRFPVAFALVLVILSYGYYLGLLFQIQIGILLLSLGLPPILYLAFEKYKSRQLNLSFPKKIGSKNLAVLLAILVLTIRFNKYVYRWGDWDAWAIWNLHAKFLFYPEHWRNIFTASLAETHPDYPLMLPSLIALFWRGLGFVTPLVPVAIAHLVLLAIPVTVYLALKRAMHSFAALLSLLIFCVDTTFIHIGGSQYADTLVAFFVLMTFVLYQETKVSSNRRLVFVLGIVAGSTSWIKNEGMLFFLVFSFSFLCFHFKKPAVIFRYILGALIPFIIVIHFKLKLAPANDLIHGGREKDLLSLISDPNRYWLIIKHFTMTGITDYWIMLLLVMIVLINKMPVIRTLPFMAISLVLVGYILVYLTTPHDLDWHLGASVDRLFHHIYPAAVYLFLLKFSENREIRLWS